MPTSIVSTSASMARKKEAQKALLKPYDRVFQPFYEALESDSALTRARRAAGQSITEQDKFALGWQLLGTLQMLNEANDVGTLADLGNFPKSILSLVQAFYSNSPLNVLASTQPISDRLGMVFFQQFIASVTRGNVTSGDILINPLAPPASYPNGYAADGVLGSNVVNDTAGGWTSTGGSPVALAGVGQTYVTPIDPRSVNIYGSTTVTVSAVDYVITFGAQRNSSTGSKIHIDPVTGAFTASALAGATRVFLYGTVNFSTGTITVTQSVASKASTTTRYYVDYDVLSEGGTDVQGGKLILVDKQIQSEDFVLKTEFGLFERFQYAQRHGRSIEDDSAKMLMTLMNQEVMYKAISILAANVPTANSVPWTRAAGNGVSSVEHQLSFVMAVNDLEAIMKQTSGRGLSINAIVAGARACGVIKSMPGFSAISNDNEFGPHIFGTLNGVTIICVPAQAVLDEWTMIGVARGTQETDAPLVWSPWMPLTFTDVLPMPNPIQRQMAAIMSGGLTSLVPVLSGKITINNSGFNYQ